MNVSTLDREGIYMINYIAYWHKTWKKKGFRDLEWKKKASRSTDCSFLEWMTRFKRKASPSIGLNVKENETKFNFPNEMDGGKIEKGRGGNKSLDYKIEQDQGWRENLRSLSTTWRSKVKVTLYTLTITVQTHDYNDLQKNLSSIGQWYNSWPSIQWSVAHHGSTVYSRSVYIRCLTLRYRVAHS